MAGNQSSTKTKYKITVIIFTNPQSSLSFQIFFWNEMMKQLFSTSNTTCSMLSTLQMKWKWVSISICRDLEVNEKRGRVYLIHNFINLRFIFPLSKQGHKYKYSRIELNGIIHNLAIIFILNRINTILATRIRILIPFYSICHRYYRQMVIYPQSLFSERTT